MCTLGGPPCARNSKATRLGLNASVATCNRTDDTIEVYTPKNKGIAPPGDYMLFILVGIRPSKAKYIRIVVCSPNLKTF